jgi:cytochrome P450
MKEQEGTHMAIQDKYDLLRIIRQQKIDDSLEPRIAWYREMREHHPIYYNQDLQVWEVFRYKDVQKVLLDHADSSVKKTIPDHFPSTLGKADPPRHRQLHCVGAGNAASEGCVDQHCRTRRFPPGNN